MPAQESKKAPGLGQNPYITQGSVGPEYGFVGRTDIINEVSNLLARPEANALFLYGQRRIGKTSLLRKLKAHLSEQKEYQAIYFDLQGKATLPLGQVLAELAFHLSQIVDMPPHTPWGAEAPRAFREEFLPAILRKLPANTTLVVFFDEFDVAEGLNETQAGKALYPYFQKTLSYNLKQFQLVFAIGRKVNDISSEALARFKGSDMLPLPLLSLEETAQVINLSQYNGSLMWPYPAMIQAQNLSGGHPLITQILCAQVWEQAYFDNPSSRPEVQVGDVDLAIPKTLTQLSKAMEWMWEGLTPAQRVVATTLAESEGEEPSTKSLEKALKERGARVIVSELQRAPKELGQWGLIEASKKGYRFPVKLQQKWITEYRPWSLVKDEIDQIQPVAATLYKEADALYQEGEFEKAIPKFRKAIRLNPNHLQASILLAESLLVLGEVSEARHILEGLHPYHPGQVHPRLVQTLLLEAQNATDETEQLALYSQILQIEPNEPEAQAAYQRIWEKRGDGAHQAGNLPEALLAYNRATMPGGSAKRGQSDETTAIPRHGALRHKSGRVQDEMSRLQLDEEIARVDRLKHAGKYQAALLVAQQLHHDHPKYNSYLPDLDELIEKAKIETTYEQALDAILQQDRMAAQALLTQVVATEPGYRHTTHYLHELTTGVDINYIQQEVEEERWARQTGEAELPPEEPIFPILLPFYRRDDRDFWFGIGGVVTILILLALCLVLLGTSAAIGSFSLAQSDETATPIASPTNGLVAPTPRQPLVLPTYTTTPMALAEIIEEGSERSSDSGESDVNLVGTVAESPLAEPTPEPTPSNTATPRPTNTPKPTETPTPEATNTPLPTNTPKTENNSSSPVATPIPTGAGSVAVFGDVLEFTGYKITRLPNEPGTDLVLTTDWKLIRNTDMQLNLSVQMLTEIDGELLPSYGQKDYELFNSKRKRTDGWPVGETLKSYKVTAPLSIGATEGRYYIAVVVYNQATPTKDRQQVEAIGNFGTLGPHIVVLQEIGIPN